MMCYCLNVHFQGEVVGRWRNSGRV